MPYVAIPSNLKNVDSVSLQMMSPENMLEMSYGEVLTAETINYRTGAPQMNGLFCQAIFGPVKDWECACGKYKRYRYAGVICDKCGVEVTHSSVRRERMGHISLATSCVHPWYLRVIPSRIALLLDMKASDLNKVTYFSAYVITEINEDIRNEYIEKIEKETKNRIKTTKGDCDNKFQELSRQYQVDKSSGKFQKEDLKAKYETDKEVLKSQQSEIVAKIETVAEVAKKELSSLKFKDVITEVMYQELSQKFGPTFKAQIGAEAVETLLKNVNLEKEYLEIKEKLTTTKGQTKKKLAKRLKLIKHFLNTSSKPEWMILKRIMVLPPDLRPMLQLDGGRFAASDLNELYRRLINRNNRLRKLIQIGAPEVILRNEKRMLQEAVEALIDNSARSGRQVMASSGIKRPLKSLTDVLKGKQGRFRQNLLGKRVDYSGRSVIIVGPNLKLDQCGIPKNMALELFKPFLMGRIISKSEKGLLPEEYQSFNVHSARRLIESKIPFVYDILDEVIKDKYVLLNRAPTLHRLSFLAFQPTLVEGKAIQLHPLVCQAFNADFDGDQMAVHLPITVKGQEEAKDLMVATRNLLKPASGELIMSGASQDIVLGCYYLTIDKFKPEKKEKMNYFASKEEAMMAYDSGKIKLQELVKIRLRDQGKEKTLETTIGRVIFNSCFPENYKFINHTMTKKVYQRTLNEAYFDLGNESLTVVLDTIKTLAYKYATQSGLSLSIDDFNIPTEKYKLIKKSVEKVKKIHDMNGLGILTNEEKHKQVVNIWRDTSDTISNMTKDTIDDFGNVGMMILSGARGNISQLNLMVGMRGLSVTAGGHIMELPAQHGYLEGLTGLEYFIGMKGQRKGQADLSLKTADAGYLTRRLVDVGQNLIIMDVDCGTEEGMHIVSKTEDADDLWSVPSGKAYGRYLAKDIVVDGKIIASRNTLIDRNLSIELKNKKISEVTVRSSTKCSLPRGICQRCYGIDFSTHRPVDLGIPIGIIGAQSLGENSTQLTMDQGKHAGGVLLKADITQGLARVEEIFEARNPKYEAPISPIDGIVEKIEGNLEQGYKILISNPKSTFSLPYKKGTEELLVEEGQTVASQDAIIIKDNGEIIRAGFDGELETSDNQVIIRQSGPVSAEFETLPGYYLEIKENQKITKGQALTEGSANMQELMDVAGVDALQEYIVKELIAIYTANGITVNEKHIEVIIKQMCNRVQIVDGGDSDYVPGDLVRLAVITDANKKLKSEGSKIITFKRVITGISRSSLTTDSFLSAASFQETSKVLVEAVISGRKDYLLGLKENVILGQLIPAGTGFNQEKVVAAAGKLEEDFDEQ